ncbi:MAG: hypothetical protein Q9163_002780 [Psora crenata]
MLAFRPWGAPRRLWVSGISSRNRSYFSSDSWRSTAILDEYASLCAAQVLARPVADGRFLRWVQKEARPISLRQLTFFGRTLTERRLIESANYVRTELPIRLSHRLRDMQRLPYVVVTNPHISHVYELYYKAFETLRKVTEITSVDENERYCNIVSKTLQEHLTVIPRLAMGVLECQHFMRPEETDRLMNTLLKSRISRRVIAEQHLSLTETFTSLHYFASVQSDVDQNADFIGQVFLRCNAQEVVQTCWDRAIILAREAYGPARALPELKLEGHLNATFPYILSHLQYIVGELLSNSLQAIIETRPEPADRPPPIEVLICEAPQHVIIRISDQGGGIPPEVVPVLWSFSKGARSQTHWENLSQVPKMAATMQELKLPHPQATKSSQENITKSSYSDASLSSIASRPPDLRLGMGLPMSRVYAEYWAGSLELHNLDGYGVDAFLQISKLGNKNEQLSTRASIDAVAPRKPMKNVSNGQRTPFPPSPAKAKHLQANALRECQSLHDLSRPTKTPCAVKTVNPARTIRRRQSVPSLRLVKEAEPNGDTNSSLRDKTPENHHQTTTPSARSSSKKPGITHPETPSFPCPKNLSHGSLKETQDPCTLEHTDQANAKSSLNTPEATQKIGQALCESPELMGSGGQANTVDLHIDVMGSTPKTHEESPEGIPKLLDNHGNLGGKRASSLMVEYLADKLYPRILAAQLSRQEAGMSIGNVHKSTSVPAISDASPQPMSREEKWARTIKIHGLDGDILSSTDFLKPIIRYHSSYGCCDNSAPITNMHSPRSIQCLDTATEWFGVTQSHAEELFRIHTAFTESVRIMLETQLEVLHNELQGQEDIGRIIASSLFTAFTDRDIFFCRRQVTDDMAYRLYGARAQPNIALKPSGLFALYLATTDCFFNYKQQDDPRDTSVTLRVYFNRVDRLQDTFIQAFATPDSVVFHDINTHPQEGQRIVITPTYECNSIFRMTDSPYKVSYKTNVSWLEWDQTIGGFRGVVPYRYTTDTKDILPRKIDGEHIATNILEVRITATMMESLHDASGTPFGFERSVNTRLLLTVAPKIVEESTDSSFNVPQELNHLLPHVSVTCGDPDGYEARVNEVLRILSPTAMTAAYQSLAEMGWVEGGRLGDSRPPRSHQMTGTCTEDNLQHQNSVMIRLAKKHASLAVRLVTLARQHANAEQHCLYMVNKSSISSTSTHITNTDKLDFEMHSDRANVETSPEDNHDHICSRSSGDSNGTQSPSVQNGETSSPSWASKPNSKFDFGPSPDGSAIELLPLGSGPPCKPSAPPGARSMAGSDVEIEEIGSNELLPLSTKKEGQDGSAELSLQTSSHPCDLRVSVESNAEEEGVILERVKDENKDTPTTPKLQPTKPAVRTAGDMEAFMPSIAKNFPVQVTSAPISDSAVHGSTNNLGSSSEAPKTFQRRDPPDGQAVHGYETNAFTGPATVAPQTQDCIRVPAGHKGMVSRGVSSPSTKRAHSSVRSTNRKRGGRGWLDINNRFAVLAELAESLTSSSETDGDNDVTVGARTDPTMWEVSSVRTGNGSHSIPTSQCRSWREGHVRDNPVNEYDKSGSAPPQLKMDATSGGAVPTHLGSNHDSAGLSSIAPHNPFWELKKKAGKGKGVPKRRVAMKRPPNDYMAKCDYDGLPGCNDCYRGQYGRQCTDDDVAVDASGNMTRNDRYSTCRNQFGASEKALASCGGEAVVADTTDSKRKWTVDGAAEITFSGFQRDDFGMPSDSTDDVPHILREDSSAHLATLEPKLSQDEERDLEIAKKRSLEEQSAAEVAVSGIPDDLDDIFDASIISDSEETLCTSDDDHLGPAQTERETDGDEDDHGLGMHLLFSGLVF